eukprot:gene3063-3831_t
MTLLSTILGFSRMGQDRELKKLIESFWKSAGPIGSEQSATEITKLENAVEQHQIGIWTDLKNQGLDLIPSGDLSLYDHVLDAAYLVGAVPKRYLDIEKDHPTIRTYFAMARGHQEKPSIDVQALPMKKWFDTNYHYIVPEFQVDQEFKLNECPKPIYHFKLAKEKLGITTKPVLLGPLSLLYLGHVVGDKVSALTLLDRLVPVYQEILTRLAKEGAQWIQLDEPILIYPLASEWKSALLSTLDKLQKAVAAVNGAKIIVTSFFEKIHPTNLNFVSQLPTAGLHIDLVRGADQLDQVLEVLPAGAVLSLGLIDGRNVWIDNLTNAVNITKRVVEKLGSDRVLVSSSCSLLHVPYSLKGERQTDKHLSQQTGQDREEILSWLQFGLEKVKEVVVVTKAVSVGDEASLETVKQNAATLASRKTSKLIRNEQVQSRIKPILAADSYESLFRDTPYHQRVVAQQKHLNLPLLPTTTIGSFPQTAEVRSVRAKFRSGKITQKEYDSFIEEEIKKCIKLQEDIGLDVLVHGEFERTDMVEFFAEMLDGYFVTDNGWVSSYGTRCVKPALLYGDVQRQRPMTVDVARYSQSVADSKRPVKGMLTGPITILQWSFIRNDQSYKETALQVALAIRDEVLDLETAGISVIQVDEPAIREGLPLDKSKWDQYLTMAVDTFKVSTGSAKAQTQIHTHMCYSDFETIFRHIQLLDADVLSIESSRSELSLLKTFTADNYPQQVGPGLYDIHSPRVPSQEELKERLLQILAIIPKDRLYVLPDCGLKTRQWPETIEALKNLVSVATLVRQTL